MLLNPVLSHAPQTPARRRAVNETTVRIKGDMRTILLAAALAATLTAGGIGTLALTGRAIPVTPDTPARAHHAIGPVAVISEARPPGATWSALHAPLLAAEARRRYGRVDAITMIRHAPLPNGAGAMSTGVAVAWD
jgi:hypothetical protein